MTKIIPFRIENRAAPTNILLKLSDRQKISKVRNRKYLLPDEVEALMKAAGSVGRHRLRDKALILAMYRHGLRVSEAIDLRWDQVDLKGAVLRVNRLKNGVPSSHPIEGDELRFLRRLRRLQDSPWVFLTERRGPMTRTNVNKLISRAGELAGLPFAAHPHQLRHACGFYLANKGIDTRRIQDYLGHKSIQHTCVYTQLAPGKFKGLWN